MSRSQKNARRQASAKRAESTGAKPDFPAAVTEKDGAKNIAGDVNRISVDQYQKPSFPTRNP